MVGYTVAAYICVLALVFSNSMHASESTRGLIVLVFAICLIVGTIVETYMCKKDGKETCGSSLSRNKIKEKNIIR